MDVLLLEGLVLAIIVSLITLFIKSKFDKTKFEVHIEQAKAKARVIEHEAEVLLKDAKFKAKKDYEKEFRSAKKEYDFMLSKIEKKEIELNTHLETELNKIEKEKKDINYKNETLENLQKGLSIQKERYEEKIEKAIKVLENVSGLTQTEAKELMILKVKEDSRAQIASIFRKKYKTAELNSQKEINNILSNAVTRYAGEFAAERLINNIPINDDETKGKIIGKEGRNIKALEMLLGVDIIIDDTPNTITVSSFNLFRRAVATQTIKDLIED